RSAEPPVRCLASADLYFRNGLALQCDVRQHRPDLPAACPTPPLVADLRGYWDGTASDGPTCGTQLFQGSLVIPRRIIPVWKIVTRARSVSEPMILPR